MKFQDIKAAIEQRDQSTIRDVFRRLAAFPDEGEIEVGSAGLLQISLNIVREALRFDAGVMPRGTCDALDLPAGSSYAAGAQAAEVQASRLARRFADALDKRAGRPGVAAGRAS